MQAAQAISSELQLEPLLAVVVKTLMQFARAQLGYLLLPTIPANNNDDASVLPHLRMVVTGKQVANEVEISHPHRSNNAGFGTPLRWDVLESVVKTQFPALFPTKVSGDKANAETNEITYVLGLPLLQGDRLAGVLYLEGCLHPDSECLEVLRLLATQAAIALRNAQLYAATRDREQELHEGKRQLGQFLEAMPVGVFIVDACGQPYYANHIARRIFSWDSVDETAIEQFPRTYQLYQTDTNQLYPTSNLPSVRALAGQITHIDNIEIRQTSRAIPLEIWGTPIYDDRGNIEYAMSVFQDVSTRQHAVAERIRFADELAQLNTHLTQALDDQVQLTNATARFVPHEFLAFLGYQSLVDVRLGAAVQQEMSILFSDIRSFTSLSEGMPPQENFNFINAFLSRMEPAITENGGFIDKYIGDEIMALFGSNADDAVQAGIAMLQRLAEYNETRQRPGRPLIRIGIGINTGTLMLGTVGGRSRMDSTVIGDAVNLAARVQTLTKDYGLPLLITDQTFRRLQDATQYALRVIDRVKLKGKSELVSVFEVFDADPPEWRRGKLATKTLFEGGVLLYHQDLFEEAAERFQSCLEKNPEDSAAQVYLERCREQIQS